jgi:hypothetical protein
MYSHIIFPFLQGDFFIPLENALIGNALSEFYP